MSFPLWPSTLPQMPVDPQYPGYPQIDPTPNGIRTSMDTGPAKQRRRFTAVPSMVTLQMHLQEAEIATLKNFVEVTLQSVLPFQWVDFPTGIAANYRFVSGQTPKVAHFAGDIWTVTISLEKLP